MITRANLIRGRTGMAGLKISTLAERSGIRPRTLSNRLREPGRITLDELRHLDNQIHFTDEEIVQLVRSTK